MEELLSKANTESKWHKTLWIVLLIIHIIMIPLSIVLWMASFFAFDGDGILWARSGVFFSALAIPVFASIAIIFSRKSLFFFLMPWLAIGSFVTFSVLINNYLNKSNLEFCMRKSAEGYRNESDFSTIPKYCEDILKEIKK